MLKKSNRQKNIRFVLIIKQDDLKLITIVKCYLNNMPSRNLGSNNPTGKRQVKNHK